MNLIGKTIGAWAFAMAAFNPATQGQTQPNPQPGTVQPNPPDVNQTPWFANQQIRQHLKFNDDQFNGLNQAYQDALMAYLKGMKKIDPTLPEAARLQRMRELQQNLYKDYSRAPEKLLTDPVQRQRYNQLYLQYRRYGAFADPAVANTLKLTPAQSDKLYQLQQEWSTQMRKLDSTYLTNREQTIKQFTIMQGQYGNQLNSILSPEQQRAWQQMIGSPYTFGPDVYLGLNARPLGGKK